MSGTKSRSESIQQARLLRRLPCSFPTMPVSRLPKEMVGATIVAIGSPADPTLINGGGLVIDYQPEGGDEVKRIALAFSDNAMWIARQ